MRVRNVLKAIGAVGLASGVCVALSNKKVRAFIKDKIDDLTKDNYGDIFNNLDCDTDEEDIATDDLDKDSDKDSITWDECVDAIHYVAQQIKDGDSVLGYSDSIEKISEYFNNNTCRGDCDLKEYADDIETILLSLIDYA